MNEQNLKGHGFHERTASEQREIAKAGGVASGKKRRFAKSIREAMEAALKEKKIDKTTGQEYNGMEVLSSAIIAKAMRGDMQAARIILELTGDINKVKQVEIKAVPKERNMTMEEAREFMDKLNDVM